MGGSGGSTVGQSGGRRQVCFCRVEGGAGLLSDRPVLPTDPATRCCPPTVRRYVPARATPYCRIRRRRVALRPFGAPFAARAAPNGRIRRHRVDLRRARVRSAARATPSGRIPSPLWGLRLTRVFLSLSPSNDNQGFSKGCSVPELPNCSVAATPNSRREAHSAPAWRSWLALTRVFQ